MLKFIESHGRFFNFLLLFFPILVLVISLVIGRLHINPAKVASILISQFNELEPFWSAQEAAVIWQLRLPRLLLAGLIGAGLGVSGAAFQGIFKNPLVSPHLMGVSSGAGFGGVLGLLFFNHQLAIGFMAFAFGILAVLITIYLSRHKQQTNGLNLILAGVISGTLFTALTSLVKFVADPFEKLPNIVFWLMGSLASASYAQLAVAAWPLILGLLVLLSIRWRINLASLSDEEAKALGVDIRQLRWLVIALVTIIVSAGVAVSGIIGWIGLVIPHAARFFVGAEHSRLLPASASLGAAYLMLVDDLARSLTPAEIPLGIITAIVGAVIFGYLLKKTYAPTWNQS